MLSKWIRTLTKADSARELNDKAEIFEPVIAARTRSLAVGLENNLSCGSGIAQFTVIPDGLTSDEDFLLVCADGVQPVEFRELSREPFRLNVHTHYLESGTQNISFRLFEQGLEVFNGTVSIAVEHRGNLVEAVRRAFIEGSVPFAYLGSCDASVYPFDQAAATPWFDRADADLHIDKLLLDRYVDEAEADQLRRFVREGYLVIEGLIDDKLVDEVNVEIDEAINSGYQGYKKGSSTRIEQLHQTRPAIRKLWLDRRHLRFADLIFNGSARPSQTLVYVCGSQQRAHQDLIHLTPFPAGYMCGTWIALQDIQPNSGELVVYPGSHRDKSLYMRDTPCAKVTNGDWQDFIDKVEPMYIEMAKKYESVTYRPKKGSVLIWHANLVHGGSVREDQSIERRSVVIHSFADGAVVFYDSTGSVGSVVERGIVS